MSREYKILRWIGAVVLPLPGIYLAYFVAKLALSAVFGIDDNGMVVTCIESVVFGMLFSMLVWKLAPECEYTFTKWYDIVIGVLCVCMVVNGILHAEKFPVRDTVVFALWIAGMIGGIAMKKSGE